MFRFAQQSQAIKGRLSSQLTGPVTSWTSHTLNYSLRYNSTDQTTFQPANNSATRLRNQLSSINAALVSGSTSNKKNNNRNNRNNKNIYSRINTSTLKPEAVWSNKVRAFEECVAQSLYMSQTPRRKNMRESSKQPLSNSDPLFWDSLSKAMELYYELKLSNELNEVRVSGMIHLLHNGLRANRYQLTRLTKKPDRDSQSFQRGITSFLLNSLRDISNDILQNSVTINEYGAMHLITSFKELFLEEEAIRIWTKSVSSESSEKLNVFLNPRVVGVMLPILYEHGTPYEEIKSLYEKSSKTLDFFHPNLAVGMIRAALSANDVMSALHLFEKLCKASDESKYGYLIETHLSFIGECKDLTIAKSFFNKVLNDDIPYKVDLQVSYVKSFMRNIWENTNDFSQIHEVWHKSLIHYGKHIHNGISSSLNDTFFDIFFTNYSNNKEQGFEELKSIIAEYNNIKKIDEPFFNIILTKCAVWRDREIIEYIDNCYDLFHIPKTIVAYRILLKSMGSVDDITTDEILKRWVTLLEKSDESRQKFIANADWAALRDSTLTWAQNEYNTRSKTLKPTKKLSDVLLKNSLLGSNIDMEPFKNAAGNLDLSHPAFQAASQSGAFDDLHDVTGSNGEEIDQDIQRESFSTDLDIPSSVKERVLLYLQIVKKFCSYCRDTKQYAHITSIQVKNTPILRSVLDAYPVIDDSFIEIPHFNNLTTREVTFTRF
ncbi:hypothetical protein TBLA_0D03540 [Henningerozyma blattae CBS 6284]|uniref:Protein RMD9, mitochondrial n=1 Tax=Henningerozyma blattae (strain ATCC 34711 / CBS 6284 / DSM 70876 / NBRC 10599 / NRRL Y-10934 / UCD 77-7) TaxID=1071380 RepID=I2H3A2_HENB6|nr:hypothetical protein TBLA_0D03540 [Tetrapisispora blattae CBS 6284]CCH60854.1 hypothetical protein TBLA_0D03540 [Tetrapisispora blattae CBS 6284]